MNVRALALAAGEGSKVSFYLGKAIDISVNVRYVSMKEKIIF